MPCKAMALKLSMEEDRFMGQIVWYMIPKKHKSALCGHDQRVLDDRL